MKKIGNKKRLAAARRRQKKTLSVRAENSTMTMASSGATIGLESGRVFLRQQADVRHEIHDTEKGGRPLVVITGKPGRLVSDIIALARAVDVKNAGPDNLACAIAALTNIGTRRLPLYWRPDFEAKYPSKWFGQVYVTRECKGYREPEGESTHEPVVVDYGWKIKFGDVPPDHLREFSQNCLEAAEYVSKNP